MVTTRLATLPAPPIAAVPRHHAVEAGTKPASRFYRPELDALRFCAFLLVFFWHGIGVDQKAGIFRHHHALAHAVEFCQLTGSYGLSLFFFLSSFLITTLLILEREKTGTVNLRSFYLRRVLRIWPLYFAFMTVTFAVGRFWPPAHFSAHALLAFFALSGNWYVIAAGALTSAMMFLWSISVEEQFYLLWPTAVRRLSTRGIGIFCASLVGASLIGIFALAASGTGKQNIWYNSVTEILFFAGGGLFALRLGLRRQVESIWKWLGGLFACVALWLAADAFASAGIVNNDPIAPWNAVSSYVFIALGVASLLWAFLHIPRRLLPPPLTYLGRISYGLYVFHGLSIVICRNFIAPHLPRGGALLLPTLALTVCFAMASYEFLEKPFLRLKYRFEVVHSRAA